MCLYIFALLLLGASWALRLHRGQITGLQLALQLGPHHFEAGTVLMSALNVNLCFLSFAHLLITETLPFRQYYQQSCGSTNVNARNFYQGVWMQCMRRGLDVGKLVGLECLSGIHNLGLQLQGGMLLDFRSGGDGQLTSSMLLHNFTFEQIQGLLAQVVEPAEEGNNVLSTAFLCPALEEYAHVFHLETRLLDGIFMERCPRLAQLIIPELAKLADVNMGAARTLSSAAHGKLSYYLVSDMGKMDLMSRYLRLGALAIYAQSQSHSHQTRIAMQSTLLPIRVTLSNLLQTNSMFPPRKGPELSMDMIEICRELADLRINASSHGFELFRLIKRNGGDSAFHVYEMLCDFLYQMLGKAEIEVTPRMLNRMIGMKIDMLIILSVYTPKSIWVQERLHSLFSEGSSLGLSTFRIPARSLLMLLWHLNQDGAPTFAQPCNLIMKYILKNMTPGSDLSILKDMKLDQFLPAAWKQRQARTQTVVLAARNNLRDLKQTNGYLETLIRSVRGRQKTIHAFIFDNFATGYTDILTSRRSVLRLLIQILENHFEYCGHYKPSGRPVYIQSLRCHPYIHHIFLRLLIQAHALRMILPFELHPSMAHALADPTDIRVVREFIATSLRYGIQVPAREGHVKSRRFRAKLTQIPALWDQLGSLDDDLVHLDDLQRSYLAWLAKWRQAEAKWKDVSVAKQVNRLAMWLDSFGLHLAAACLELFKVWAVLDVSCSQNEGLSLLFNQL